MEEEDADITLCLVARRGRNTPPLLRLHSGVLAERSDFFASLLSERWRANKTNHNSKLKPSEEDKEEDGEKEVIHISVPPSRSPGTYQRCIRLMYVPRHALLSGISAGALFGSVQEALDMLEVAAEFLFLDCSDACQAFIERRLSWTPEEESAVRACLSSLQLSAVNADLAARLRLQQPQAAMAAQLPGADANWAMQVQRDALAAVLRHACSNTTSKGSSTPWFKGTNLVISPGRPVPQSAILQAWNANLDVLKALLQAQKDGYNYRGPKISEAELKAASSMLDWLLFRLLDLCVAHVVVEAFAIDTQLSELTKAVLLRRETRSPSGPYDLFLNIRSVDLLRSIIGLVHGGLVLLPQSVRMSLISTWIPAFQQLRGPPNDLEKPFCDIILSLPLTQQGEFLHDWYTGSKPWPDLRTLFGPYCEKLRQAHLQHGQSHGALLISED